MKTEAPATTEKPIREHAKKAVANKRDKENALYSLAMDLVTGLSHPKSMYDNDGNLRIL